MRFDVAIVGAGPAGCATAITLAQRGHQVVLIDRGQFPRDKLCGDFINPINWPALRELEVAQDLQRVPHCKVSGFRISALDGAVAMSALPSSDEAAFGLAVQRYHFDQVLLDRAQHTGVTVYQGARLRLIKSDLHGWRLDVDGVGHERSIAAKLLVGADGRNSTVARQLGMPMESPKPLKAVGFQVQLRGVSAVRDNVEIHQFGAGYAGLVRVAGDTVNLALTIKQSELQRGMSFEVLRDQLLCRNPVLDGLIRASQPVARMRSAWPVYGTARRRFGAGYLLVGDAARVIEPVTGEGVYFALRGGQLAGTVLADALAVNDFSAARLAAYEPACRAEFAARIRVNAMLRQLVYRPRLLSLALRFVGRRPPLLNSLVNVVCQPRASFAG